MEQVRTSQNGCRLLYRALLAVRWLLHSEEEEAARMIREKSQKHFRVFKFPSSRGGTKGLGERCMLFER